MRIRPCATLSSATFRGAYAIIHPNNEYPGRKKKCVRVNGPTTMCSYLQGRPRAHSSKHWNAAEYQHYDRALEKQSGTFIEYYLLYRILPSGYQFRRLGGESRIVYDYLSRVLSMSRMYHCRTHPRRAYPVWWHGAHLRRPSSQLCCR